MNFQKFRSSEFDRLILNVVEAYEARFQHRLRTMERLISGAVRKRLWFYAVWIFVNLSPTKFSNRLEPYLKSTSRQDLTGARLTGEAWKTCQRLSALDDLSERDIRIAAMRGFFDKQGKVDIFMSLLRCLALLASGFIAAITLVFATFFVALWSGFVWSTHYTVIGFQLAFFPALSVVMVLICMTISYGIFVNGVLPLSIAYRFKRLEKEFLKNGIMYQIHE